MTEGPEEPAAISDCQKALRRSSRRRREKYSITFSGARTSKKYFAGRTRPDPFSQKRCKASFLTRKNGRGSGGNLCHLISGCYPVIPPVDWYRGAFSTNRFSTALKAALMTTPTTSSRATLREKKLTKMVMKGPPPK